MRELGSYQKGQLNYGLELNLSYFIYILIAVFLGSLTYMFFMMLLVITLGNPGQFIAMILLVLQVASIGCSKYMWSQWLLQGKTGRR